MRFPKGFSVAAVVASMLAFGPSAQAAPEAQVPGFGDKGWTTEGEVSVVADPAGGDALVLKRDPVQLPATKAVSGRFALSPGVWELTGACESDLHSPDVSFNVAVSLRMFDQSGKEIKKRRLLAVPGQSSWKPFKERLEVPAGSALGSVEVEFHKTHGVFRLRGLALKYVGASIPMEGGDRKTVFRSNRAGNLFYPGDSVRIEMEVETPAVLSGKQLRVSWQATDFWKAPAGPAREAQLAAAGKSARGWNLYRTVLDADPLALAVGPYYEIHTVTDLGAPSPARDQASLAILPEPVTMTCDPMEIPFGAHTWNATVYDYFPLAARLGIRRCLVFWNWPDKAPYTPAFDEGYARDSRLEWPKRFGIAPYGVLYPVMNIEHREGPDYSDEALREGIRQSIEKYKGDGLWGFQIGNEPPHWNPDMVRRDVETYKVAYEAIKATDPEFTVIGSAIGPNETFFKAGFQPWQDVYNIHAYSDLGELRHAMKRYREMFRKYGGEKPIWSTEIGSKSQGLPRDVIARDIVRKAVCFFADGGQFFTWFAVGGMPDPDGERAGGYSDSMDLFAGKYNMHLPRLDAVACYHLINTLAVKKFVAETQYPGGTQGFLFRDTQANALLVFWNPERPGDVFVPLPGVHEVCVTHLDGAVRRLDAGGKGIHLRIGADPVLVAFRGGNGLPEALPRSAGLDAFPETLIQGQTAEVTVRTPEDRPLALVGPALWTIGPPEIKTGNDGSRTSVYKVKVPEDTTARLATFRISDETVTRRGDTELRFAIPIRSRIDVDLLPVGGQREGDAAVRLLLANHSDSSQRVDWNVEILNELPMANGTYALGNAGPSRAHFAEVTAGTATLGPREQKEFALTLRDADRQTIYQLRASAADASGNVVQRERRFGGFARAVRAKQAVGLDGRLDEAAWKTAPVYRLNEERQFCAVKPDAPKWRGEDDLSGTLQFLWDDTFLYVGARVRDDVFANPKSDSEMWNQDGLQFLIDPYREKRLSLGRYDYSMGIGRMGSQAWCHMSADPGAPAGAVSDIKIARESSSPDRGDCTYEVAIPWKRLAPFQPKGKGNLGLTMVINEDDGSGRKSTIGWLGGVHLKEALFVGDLILEE